MRFAIESWAPDYGTAMGAGELAPSQSSVNPGVEVDPAAWAPVTPRSATPAVTVRFVDGVRRIDARVWIAGDDGVSRPGVAASYAAGVVCCADVDAGNGQGPRRAATIETCEVRRGVFSAAPSLSPITTRHGAYSPCVVAGDGDEDFSLGLQHRMGELEARVATEVARSELLVIDGPLSKLPTLGSAVGFIKTHQKTYLPDPLAGVVGALRAGQRTPLFVTTAGWSRYSWYARLPAGRGAANGSGGHPWAGVVRGEVSGDLATDEARRLADLATVTLPLYASVEHKDPRAPQNLYPIAELERCLRQRLGDPALMLRALRTAAVAA
jgi:hypothetical protein